MSDDLLKQIQETISRAEGQQRDKQGNSAAIDTGRIWTKVLAACYILPNGNKVISVPALTRILAEAYSADYSTGSARAADVTQTPFYKARERGLINAGETPPWQSGAWIAVDSVLQGYLNGFSPKDKGESDAG